MDAPTTTVAAPPAKKRQLCKPCTFFGLLMLGLIIWGIGWLIRRFAS